MTLKSPIVVSSCPMALHPEKVRELSIAGMGAVVLPSLFEEQIVHQRNLRGELVSDSHCQLEWMYDNRRRDSLTVWRPLHFVGC